ncbi:MAG: tRNA adenosine(34) deaminase TadA [Clostridia bacterium]|nr:tRNA adenosine(34) deaminase TadA [Clostridia bacterium]
MDDKFFMKKALRQAQLAYRSGEVPVGAVIVKDGKVIARGKNARETGKSAVLHAELSAIQKACKKLGGWRLTGCTLYVTLEPCIMCAGAIMNARIDRVVIAAADKKAGAYGGITDINALPVNHKPQVKTGVLEEQCSEILKDFFKQLRLKNAFNKKFKV